MYKFQKYGTLMYYNGLPVYVGNRCITDRKLVWWWPVNWVVVTLAMPIVIYRILKDRFAH